MNRRNELVKGSIDSLLLCLIGQQPMYGYQIIKELENKSQGYFKYKEGTLYPALHRLEKANLLVGKWEAASGGRQRRYYHITEKGRENSRGEESSMAGFSVSDEFDYPAG